MDKITQDKRLISIESPLGKDVLLLTGFDGNESISRPFEFQLTVLSSDLNIKPETLIGKAVTVRIKNTGDRVFHGYISHFTASEVRAHKLREYHLTMVPWLWFLSKNVNRRIFQDKNVEEIVTAIFKDRGMTDYKFILPDGRGHTKREYCVQYAESDLHFISRLLEEEGICYFFTHENNKHTLIMTDGFGHYPKAKETNLNYAKGSFVGTQITQWRHQYEFRTGAWMLNDYNFTVPNKDMKVASGPTSSKFVNSKNYENYEYPGWDHTSVNSADGQKLAKIRLDADEVALSLVHGASNCSSFHAGAEFSVAQHEISDAKGSYVLRSVTHHATDHSYYGGDDGGGGQYSNTFTCFPSKIHYAPPRVHEKSFMRGPQTAMVTGPAGEEIYIDQYGRIKAQFIWDRDGKKDEHSSVFLRVMQTWAGNAWGASFIPRIGHEVIVTFLDGDPDRPIVTGTVYNGANKIVYPSKTQSGIKTRSTKGGTPDNFNELRFEDLKGSEQIFIHAEKNMDTEVENDETLTVDHDRTKTIKHDENSFINHDRNKTVDNNQTETIGKDKTITVGQHHSEDIGKNMTIHVGMDLKESVDGKYLENVTKEYVMQAKTITLNAQDKITFVTGSAQIEMKSNGDITISGATINVKGSGNVIIKGSKVLTN